MAQDMVLENLVPTIVVKDYNANKLILLARNSEVSYPYFMWMEPEVHVQMIMGTNPCFM